MTDAKDEPRDDAKTSAIAAGILGAILTLGALGTHGPKAAASVALGALIALANLLTMRAIVRALLVAPAGDAARPDVDEGVGAGRDAKGDARPDGASRDSAADDGDANRGRAADRDAPAGDRADDHRGAGKRGGAAWGVFAVLKIFVLFGAIWILLTRGLVDPIPLVVGYGVLPLGIAAASLWSNLRPSR